MFHPTRGGNRGGQDQFDWEDVKSDKHRESYLGHSVKAPVGRWQKGKDLHWYTRSGKVDSSMSKQQEKDAIKKMEAEALAIALGKGDNKKVGSGVTKQELAEVCRKGQVERDSMDIERVEGMGFGSTRARLMYGLQSEPVKETLGATGSQQERGADPVTKSFQKTREDGSCTEDGQSRDKTKKKKDKKEKKSKKKRSTRRKGTLMTTLLQREAKAAKEVMIMMKLTRILNMRGKEDMITMKLTRILNMIGKEHMIMMK
ncbi:hypothetical protein OS493_016090 [Desmophyllum pertusum]|uniref:Multiple myeloma tumor-associated protein 2-like N-terminal domain-containing protein n=1 Tax=Desmophyllum pertusum TaxID=174260 RepID=A0A9X0A1R8_9CNID|nr:hypothetical protein OS493_016090 [Desmophyllum pertusum]